MNDLGFSCSLQCFNIFLIDESTSCLLFCFALCLSQAGPARSACFVTQTCKKGSRSIYDNLTKVRGQLTQSNSPTCKQDFNATDMLRLQEQNTSYVLHFLPSRLTHMHTTEQFREGNLCCDSATMEISYWGYWVCSKVNNRYKNYQLI